MIRIIFSDSNDPYYNLALEERLFHICEDTLDFILYLWQNENTIVIGRNQNVFTECNMKYALTSSTKIVRRMTGGGAVFHDLGNLNYSMIVPKDVYNKSKFCNIIINALKELGIVAKADGRNDITINQLKCSGNAYYSSKYAVLHHGTLLVDVDLKRMQRLLSTSGSKISRKGIKSIRSRVINLKELNENITIELLKTEIISSFCREFPSVSEVRIGMTERELSDIKELKDKYESEDWNYKQIREYAIKVEETFECGNMELTCEMNERKITDFSIVSDSLYPDLIESIAESLRKGDISVFDEEKMTDHDEAEVKVIKSIELLYNRILKMIDN